MLRCFLVFICLVCAQLMPAEAKRVALVIGNNAYANLPDFRQLQKAVNDARSMRDTLRDDLGFNVNFAENADFRTMNNGFKNFEATVEPGDVVFLFFSGHGVSIGGENYLLPSDIPLPVAGEEQRLIGSSFGAEQLVLRLKKRGARAIFAVLDACRDDPFESENGKAVGGPSGLTKMDAAEGVFILFAAGVRQTALDRLYEADNNPNSVFTRSLIPALKTGGLSQVDLAKRVYKEVKAAAATIGHDQTPAYYDQIDGYVMLKEGEAVSPLELPGKDPAEVAFSAAGENAAMLKVVVDNFPGTVWAKLAAARLAEQQKRVAVLVPQEPATPPGVTINCITAVGGGKCLKPGDSFTDCADCPEMVVVPAGSFMMGSASSQKNRDADEQPQHKVTFSARFAVGKFEITRGQFAEFMRESKRKINSSCWVVEGNGNRKNVVEKSYLSPGFLQDEQHPAVCVSWSDAHEFTKWLSNKTGEQYRLLSEAEWEYAAGAGQQKIYEFGNLKVNFCALGNFADEAAAMNQAIVKAFNRYSSDASFVRCNDGAEFTASVGKYSENEFGLKDMRGNVSEWVQDCYTKSYSEASPIGEPSEEYKECDRVVRGENWFDEIAVLSAANRASQDASAGARFDGTGFRIARTF